MKNQQLMGLLKSLTKQYRLTSQENSHIKSNVAQIEEVLAPIVDIRKYQNYGEANLYAFDDKQIDLLALNYVNRRTYRELNEKIDQHHQGARNCLICQLKKQIYCALQLIYNKDNITFTDLKDINSIIIKINEQDFKYVIKIKVMIISKSYLAITCKDQYYCQSMDWFLFRKYKILNKLTNNRLKYLCFLLKIINIDSKKNYQLSKLIILSSLDECLWKDKWFSLWISNNFNHLFKNKTTIDELLEQDHFSRYYNSLSNRLFKLYRYDKLKFVYHNIFADFIVFCNVLISQIISFNKFKTFELNLLIKMNLIILNSKWNSKITFHDKKNYLINHKNVGRLVYNKELDHNNFIVHLIYLQEQIVCEFTNVEILQELLALIKTSETMNLYLFAKAINEMILTNLGGE